MGDKETPEKTAVVKAVAKKASAKALSSAPSFAPTGSPSNTPTAAPLPHRSPPPSPPLPASQLQYSPQSIELLRSKFLQQCQGKLHFIHVGKTGGSSASVILKKAIKEAKSTPERVGLYINAHFTRLGHKPKGCYTLFVRDPVDRWISGFLSRARQGCPSHCFLSSRNERVMFHNYPSPNDLAEAMFAPRGFQHAVQASQQSLHIAHGFKYYLPHFQQNTERILFVGSMSSMNQDVDVLLQILGLTVKSKRMHLHTNPKQLSDMTHLSNKGRCMLEKVLQTDFDILRHLWGKRLTNQHFKQRCNQTTLLQTRLAEKASGYAAKAYVVPKCRLVAEALQCKSCGKNYEYLKDGTYYKCQRLSESPYI